MQVADSYPYARYGGCQARLMCSGSAANENRLGKQLIKSEWDLIEAWLNSNTKDAE
ncbi:MAG: hypothetical protein RLZZ214_3117 [Verrucomicrobiota bacterium]|jgi:hypothetical protein